MRPQSRASIPWSGSAAAARGPAVEALVARAVADHDRAAVHARRGVGLGGEGDLRAAQVESDPAAVLRLGGVAIGVAVRVPIGVAIGGTHGREIAKLHALRLR